MGTVLEPALVRVLGGHHPLASPPMAISLGSKYPRGMPLVSPLVRETNGMGGEAPPTPEEEAQPDDETKGSRVSSPSENRPNPREIQRLSKPWGA